MLLRYSCLSFFLSSTAVVGWSQSQFEQPKASLSVDVGIPTWEQNKSLRRVMNGVFNGGIGYQYDVFQGIMVGAGIKYSLFALDGAKLDNSDRRGALHFPSIHGKVGYEKWTTDRISIAVSLRSGYTLSYAFNDSCQAARGGPFSENTFFMEPQLELLLLTAPRSSEGFSFVLGYNFIFSTFGPRYLCVKSIPNSLEEDYQGITRFLSIGFGYRHYIKPK